jgi:hypothetical protein
VKSSLKVLDIVFERVNTPKTMPTPSTMPIVVRTVRCGREPRLRKLRLEKRRSFMMSHRSLQLDVLT